MKSIEAFTTRIIDLPDSSTYPDLSHRLSAGGFVRIWAIGDLKILENLITAFFCSSKCPGRLILRVYDLAESLRDAGSTVISGFDSPMEKEWFEILLRGDQPIVICPTRGIDGMRLPAAWRKGICGNRLLLLSPFERRLLRPTLALTEIRNRFVTMVADSILVAHANRGSKTERTCLELLETGKSLYAPAMTENNELLERGAIGIRVEELPDFCVRRSTND